MRENQEKYPYRRLGRYLKQLRVEMKESMAEVSGAVELDVSKLADIETGSQRPSEDILLLLISHFNLKEDEAVQVWELAEFDGGQLPDRQTGSTHENLPKNAVLVMPEELKISYTDMAHVSVNNYGVIVNFMQGQGAEGRPMIVSRVGMSKDHARSLIKLLQKTIDLNDEKSQTPEDNNSDKA